MSTELVGLGILFLCAIFGGIIAAKLKQPAVLGLLLVGAVIGPNALNLVKDTEMISMMADFGAILILFIIGLEFDIPKLMKLGIRPVIIGLLKFGFVLFIGYHAMLLLGYTIQVALFVGVILSFSSTVVVVKILEQKEMVHRKEVPLLIAVLIVEDVLAVLVLTFFSGIEDTSKSLMSTFEGIIFSMAILVVVYLVSMKLLKYVVKLLMHNSKDESALTFLSLGVGVLFSYFASYLGFTPSAGAFLAGSLVASLPNAREYKEAIHPYALSFTSIFFIAMGTLINVKAVEENIILIGILVLLTFISRLVAVGSLTYLFANFKNEQPFFSSLALIPIGEFSLLVAKESEKFGLGIDLVTVTAGLIFLTALSMPICINYTRHSHNSAKRFLPWNIELKLEKVSNYIRKFFDSMETETSFTLRLKADSTFALKMLGLTVLTFVLARKLAQIIAPYGKLWTIILYSITGIIMIVSLFIVYRRAQKLHHTLAVILTNVDSTLTLRRCKRVINNVTLGLVFLVSALVFPFAMFTLELPPLAYGIPVLLGIMAIYFLKNIQLLVELPTPQAMFEQRASSFGRKVGFH